MTGVQTCALPIYDILRNLYFVLLVSWSCLDFIFEVVIFCVVFFFYSAKLYFVNLGLDKYRFFLT